MAENRVFIEKGSREFIDKLKEEDVLGFNTVENIDLYLFFAALGNEEPIEINHKDGYVRVDGERKTDLKAKISSFLISTFNNDDDLDEYADFEKCIEYSDKCARAGYLKFMEMYNNTENEDNLIKKLEIQLNNIYSNIFN